MNPQAFDCIVIGAGVVGSFHAYHAARQGWKVLLLEKDGRPNEATVRNFGMAIPSGLDQGKWQELGRRSLEIYKDIQAQFDLSVRQQGSIYFASDSTEMTLLEELAAINEKNGYPSQLVDKESCLERYPGLRASYCVGGLFFPEEVTVEPQTMIHRLIAFIGEMHGVQYKNNTQVRAIIDKTTHSIVETSDGGQYAAPRILVCSGRDFKTLYPQQFADSDIIVTKLQMMATSPMEDFVLPSAVLSGLSIRRYESFQECPSYDRLNASVINEHCKKWGIHVLFKQAMDGSIILGDSHEYASVKEADQLGFECKQVINDIILQESQRIFNLPHWNITRQWNGFYAQRPSHEIYLEKADTHTWIITAIGGKGMTVSAGLAESHIRTLFN